MAENENPTETEGNTGTTSVEEAAGSRTLGLERWVQLAFIGVALAAFYLLDKIVAAVWDLFAEPEATLVTAVSAALGLLTGFVLYKHPRVNELAHEVVNELSKVTWPTRKETWSNTVVTVITAIIAALILFGFDMMWSSITDLIYKV